MKPKLIIGENINKLIVKLAEEIVGIIKYSQKQSINIALSGGTTPKTLYEYIAAEYSNTVDWEKVYFWWGDERCVPPNSNESNYRMAKESILDKLKISPGNIIRIKGENNPENEAENYSTAMKNKLPAKNSLPVFDIILLGLGEDGHTVSIFPDQIKLFNSKRFAEVTVHPESKQKRITITGSVINNAVNIFFLVTGKGKANVINEIINKSGNFQAYPASLVLPKEANFKWYLDSEAAEKL